jgi:hypothetical protein
MRIFILSLVMGVLFVFPAYAGVNISFSSNENKDVKIESIGATDLNYSGNSSFSYDIPYENYGIQMTSNTTNLNNGSLMSNIRGVVNQRYAIIWLALFAMIALFAWAFVRGL